MKSATHLNDNSLNSAGPKWTWLGSKLNPDYEPPVPVDLRSCLRNDNSSRNLNDGHWVFDRIFGYIELKPKWLSLLHVSYPDGRSVVNSSDTFKQRRSRKKFTVDRFCDMYDPLWRSRKVSLIFHTFTRVNYARLNISVMLELVKARYAALKRPLRGYLWVLEIAPNSNMRCGYHIHYHLLVAVDRVRWPKIPSSLKFEDVWGQRTGIEFVKYSLRGYLTKYFLKSEAHLLRLRSYGISRILI
jgi:hypothetical protein